MEDNGINPPCSQADRSGFEFPEYEVGEPPPAPPPARAFLLCSTQQCSTESLAWYDRI